MATQTTTVTGQQSIPTELMPYFVGAGKPGEEKYVPGLLPRAQELYSKGYMAEADPTKGYAGGYGTQLAASGLGGAGRVAGLSDLEQQVRTQLGQMQTPNQFLAGTNISGTAGQGQLGTVGQASGYGQMGAGFGTAGVGLGQQAASLAPQAQAFGNIGVYTGETGKQLGVGGGQRFGEMGAAIGHAGQNLGFQGGRFGQQGADYGMQGAQMAGMGFGAGQRFEGMATSPGAQQAFMSPYMQNVVDLQKQQAIRDYDIASQGRNAQAVRAGAFGGSRQAVAEAEANRALMSQLGGIQATGTQKAFEDAQRQMQFGSQLGLQGLQAGYQGLQTGIQGAQTGLQGIDRQLAGTAQGMQGAQIGLQGVDRQLAGTAQGMQGAQIGLQGLQGAQEAYRTGLQGTAQGMQGAQIGLQGVGAQQAGYAGANQAAATLGQLGTMQQAADMERLKAMSAQGGVERGITQQGKDAEFSDLMNRINYPTEQLGGMANILRGVPTTQGSQTSTTTAPPPSFASQLAGTGLSGLALYNMLK